MNIFKNVFKGFVCLLAAIMLMAGAKGFCQGNEEAPAPEKQKKIQVSGTVNYVDSVAGTMTVSGERGVLVITVPDDVKIVRGYEKLHLDEVHAGDSVLVQCTNPEPGTYVAVSMTTSKAF